jgi:Fe-S cluster assembly protein SufD
MSTPGVIQQQEFMQHLADVFLKQEATLNGKAGSDMHRMQQAALESLLEMQFPDRRHEDWKYTPVTRLLGTRYNLPSTTTNEAIADIPGVDSFVLEITNGRLNAHHSHSDLLKAGVQVISLGEAYQLDTWQQHFSRYITADTQHPNKAFDYLNFAFQTGGLFIHIPANLVLDKPIELRITHDDANASFSHPLYFVYSGKNSAVTFFERFEQSIQQVVHSEVGFINSIGFFHLAANASVDHIKWQNLPANQHLVYRIVADLEQDSRFTSFAFDRGGQVVRNNIDVDLAERNSYASLQAAYIASGKQSIDHQTRINHTVAHCESHELYKGIIDGQASAAFNGKVYVHPDAQKTNAYQQNDTMVISPHALMNSKPQLEIFADDVKCSHGATIGQLDGKLLFYLKSRGLTEAQATDMLKAAFLAVVLDEIKNDAIRQFVTSQLTPSS